MILCFFRMAMEESGRLGRRPVTLREKADFASPHLKPPLMGNHVHFLNGTHVNVGGKPIAGVSGVIGNPRKNFRRTHQELLDIIQYVLLEPTDILVLHDGPDAPMPRYQGISEVREILERIQPKSLCQLVIRGHKHLSLIHI